MGRRDFQGRTAMWKAGIRRMEDAKELVTRGTNHTRGAMYLAGYAIECRLKAIAMEVFDVYSLEQLGKAWGVEDEREVYHHGLEVWIERLPLAKSFRQSDLYRRDFVSQVNQWKPSWRYAPDLVDEERATIFINA
jgi:hypothetical protein